MPDRDDNNRRRRVLVCVTGTQDASVILEIVAGLGAEGHACDDACEFPREIAAGADAIVVSEERLTGKMMSLMAGALRDQPEWSEIPAILIAAGGVESAAAAAASHELGGVLILDRPVRLATMAAMLDMALRSRERQRQVRDLLDELRRREEQLSEFNRMLEVRVADRTRESLRLAEQLRSLAAELTIAEERERRRLAGVLHDHIQQLLAAARLRLQLVRPRDADAESQSGISEVDSIIRDVIEASRSLTLELSPPALYEGGLAGGLVWLAKWTAEKYRFTVHVRADPKAEPKAEDVRLMLFECVRELILNARKHSGIDEAFVIMDCAPSGGTRVVVEDKGRGFNPKLLKDRPPDEITFGLFSIEQRLAHFCCSIDIASAPGKGTRVTLTAPPASVTCATG